MPAHVGMVSNIDDDQLAHLLEVAGVAAHFDSILSSESARSCKPHGGIFAQALERAGCRPHEALFVGDSLHHDVAGADAIGMRSARIVEEGIETPLTHGLEITAEPTYEINHLTDLVDIVEQNNGG